MQTRRRNLCDSMKQFWSLVFFLFFFSENFVASPVDSLVLFSDLTFKNEFEKAMFINYSKLYNKTDAIDLFLSPYDKPEGYSSKGAHQKINECVQVLKKETEGMTVSRRVKFIYKYVHKSFFRVYKLNNSFSDIFENGEYNCVSASALYAIIFKEMAIPYQIIEAPQHVFIIAYPQSDKILIETTSPENGYLKFPDNFVEDYINYMKEAKLISKEEYENSNAKDLFNKYYYSESGVSLVDLAGIQYSNYAIYDLNTNNYEKGITEILKAFYLSPSERIKYLLKSLLVYQLRINDYSNQKQVGNLVTLCRFNNLKDKEFSNEVINNEFLRVINSQLIKNSDYAQFDLSFKLVHQTLIDSTIKREIEFDYHYELARLGYNNFKSKEYELEHLVGAYKINSKHANLRNLVLGYFGRLVDKNNDPVFIINLMKEFTSTFDFLTTNNQFNSIRVNAILELAYQYLSVNNINKGESYLKEFEDICNINDSLTAATYYVEKAYSVAASYYYKKGDKVKTRQLLKTGLKYAPDSFGLKQRLEQVY